MGSFTAIILLAFASQARARETRKAEQVVNKLVANIVDNLFSRAPKVSSFHRAHQGDLDTTTIGKALPQQNMAFASATSSRIPAPYPVNSPPSTILAPPLQPTTGDSASPSFVNCHFSKGSPCVWPQSAPAVGRRALTAGMVASLLAGASSPSRAGSGEIIGEIEASGLVFKDTIDVQRIVDPKVSGVTLYQVDFARSGVDKLKSGNIFSDPSASGLSCAVNGKVLADPGISMDKKGEQIYEEKKALLGKTLKVKRVFDKQSQNVVYVVYTERLNKDDDPNGSRFKTQSCAVHVEGFIEK